MDAKAVLLSKKIQETCDISLRTLEYFISEMIVIKDKINETESTSRLNISKAF